MLISHGNIFPIHLSDDFLLKSQKRHKRDYKRMRIFLKIGIGVIFPNQIKVQIHVYAHGKTIFSTVFTYANTAANDMQGNIEENMVNHFPTKVGFYSVNPSAFH